MKTLRSLFLCLVGLTPFLTAQEATPKPATEPKPAAAKFLATDGYALDTCIISGETLDDGSPTLTVEGHTFKTCCKGCLRKIEKDAKGFIAKKEDAVKQAQGATYALTTCPVCDKGLGAKAVEIVANDTLVKVCCETCKEKVAASATAAVAKVQHAAFAKQSTNYAATTCPISGHELDDQAVAVMHGTTLVKLCCEDCLPKFKATPNAHAAKVALKKGDKNDGAGKGETKRDPKGGGEVAATAGGEKADCCESKAGASCCSSGKTEAKSGSCCEAAKTDAKTEAKPGSCCEAKTEAKPEAKAAKKDEKKIN